MHNWTTTFASYSKHVLVPVRAHYQLDAYFHDLKLWASDKEYFWRLDKWSPSPYYSRYTTIALKYQTKANNDRFSTSISGIRQGHKMPLLTASIYTQHKIKKKSINLQAIESSQVAISISVFMKWPTYNSNAKKGTCSSIIISETHGCVWAHTRINIQTDNH